MSSDSGTALALALVGFVPQVRVVEPAGLFYETRQIRDLIHLNKCTLPVYRNKNAPVEEVTVTNGNGKKSKKAVEEPVEDRLHLFDADGDKYQKYLMKLDPSATKDQDHYKVLGLSKLRWQASTSEIRTAYRQKVLKHHPDKKKHKGIALPAGEDYYVCITKAYEQLGTTEAKRRAYDSVDPKFDDEIPTEKEVTSKNFFNKLTDIFEKNGRWSTKQRVPLLGDANTPRDDVEEFYSFWFEWNSWREFSYLDEEDKERGEDRWERREMEKANKVERERRRKEESKRIRTLIEMAYSKDPRIAQFKKDDVAAKEKAKEERARAKREAKEAEERAKFEAEEAIRKAKEEEERKIKEAKDELKRQKDAARKAAAQAKKRLDNVGKQCNYWSTDSGKQLKEMERIERLNLMLTTEQLNALCDQLEQLSTTDFDSALDILDDSENVKKEKKIIKTDKGKENQQDKNIVLWTDEELQLLTKAANLYPSGTVERWIAIADYVNEHRKDKSTTEKNEKQVIKQVKMVHAGVAKPTAASQNTLGAQAIPTAADEDVWSPADQKLLEDALRVFPGSDAERWEKISASIPGKSKKACIRRFKHLVQMVKNAKN